MKKSDIRTYLLVITLLLAIVATFFGTYVVINMMCRSVVEGYSHNINCSNGPPSETSGNCKPLCIAPKLLGCYNTKDRASWGWKRTGTATVSPNDLHTKDFDKAVSICKGHRYMSMECPGPNGSEVWCGDQPPPDSAKLSFEECQGNPLTNIGNNKSNMDTCPGPYTNSDGTPLGGWYRGVVYDLGMTEENAQNTITDKSALISCPEKERSNKYMYCPSYDQCSDGPWYKTLIQSDDQAKSDLAQPHGGVSPNPTTIPKGDITVPGTTSPNMDKGPQGALAVHMHHTTDIGSDLKSGYDAVTGDLSDFANSIGSELDNTSQFFGGKHEHHYHFNNDLDGKVNRKWQNEVQPSSTPLIRRPNGQNVLANQMSAYGNNQCTSSITGAFQNCGPSAANIPCYELFNN